MRPSAPGVLSLVLVLLVTPLPLTAVAGNTILVFSTEFESGLPPEISAPGSVLDNVQGYAGLGPAGRQFDGSFLRYTSVPIHPTTLTVRNLPAHDHLSVKFLLGLIDSWDGTELMQISVDGALVFNHWFQLATGDTTSYHPAPPGAILSMGTNLGFSGCCYYDRDRAYDLGVEPVFLDIPHTADSVQVVWTLSAVSGPAATQWQGGNDESWAIDALSVEVSTQNVDVGDVTAPGRLAVVAAPNPARAGAVRLQLAFPAAGPVRVELVDLAGRRIAQRDLAAAGGSLTLDLSAGRLSPGLYFARVTQGTEIRTARVIVTD